MNRRELLKFPIGLSLAHVFPTFSNQLESVTLASPLEVERFSKAMPDADTDCLFWDIKLKRFGSDQPILALDAAVESSVRWIAPPGEGIVFSCGSKSLNEFHLVSNCNWLRRP